MAKSSTIKKKATTVPQPNYSPNTGMRVAVAGSTSTTNSGQPIPVAGGTTRMTAAQANAQRQQQQYQQTLAAKQASAYGQTDFASAISGAQSDLGAALGMDPSAFYALDEQGRANHLNSLDATKFQAVSEAQQRLDSISNRYGAVVDSQNASQNGALFPPPPIANPLISNGGRHNASPIPYTDTVSEENRYKNYVSQGLTPDQIVEAEKKNKAALQSTFSNTGLQGSFDPKTGLYVKGSEGSTPFTNASGSINDKNAQQAAAKKAANEAEIANIKGFTTRTDENGNQYTVEDPNLTQQKQQEARLAQAQRDAADAANRSVLQQNLDRNQSPGGTITSPDGSSWNVGSQGKTFVDTSVPSLTMNSLLAGLPQEKQQQMMQMLGPDFLNWANGKLAGVDATTPEAGDNINQVIQAQNKMLERVFGASEAFAGKLDEFNKLQKSQADTEAKDSLERARGEEDLLRRQSEEKFNRAIRDQEIQNERDREQFLNSSGISGAWKSSRHSADVIHALEAGERALTDLKTDSAFSTEFFANKISDIEQNYLQQRQKNANAYQVASLQLQQNLMEEAKSVASTVFATTKDQLEAKERLKEKWIEEMGNLAEKRADREWDVTKFLTTETRLTTAEARQQQNNVMNDAEFGLTHGLYRNAEWLNSMNSRLNSYGLSSLPTDITTFDQQRLALDAIQTQKEDMQGNYFSTLPGKYFDQDGKTDLGLLLARSVQDLDKTKRFDNSQLGEAMLARGNISGAKDQILTNTYLSMDTQQRVVKDAGDTMISSIDSLDGILSGYDPTWGPYWNKLKETNKPLANLQRDPNYIAISSVIGEMTGVLLKQRFGAALTGGEEARANDYLVNLAIDTPADVENKLKNLKAAILRSRAVLYNNRLGGGAYESLTGNSPPSAETPTGGFSGYDGSGLDFLQGGNDFQLSQPETAFKSPPSVGGGFIDTLAIAHQKHEGYYPGSRAYRNNNPGNLKDIGQKGVIGRDKDGFAIFPDYQTGYNAMKGDLIAKIAGGSRHIDYSKNPTLLDYVKVYAPADDGNNPNGYANALIADLQRAGYKVSPKTPLSQLATLIG